ncbi:hypothetical protein [uncultured Ruegeria sp.]|uniref:hypothetical protein n=1 Tax=uncultured Ruegeria sp. TaxID=259304 RepID=UPI002622E05E|nr:hypothetical protein [uncultured Ruegeria sp.]
MPLSRGEIGVGLLAVLLVLAWYASKDLCRASSAPGKVCAVLYGSDLQNPSSTSTKGSR